MSQNVQPFPEGMHTVSPYLIVTDGNRALDFYQAAFGAEVTLRHDDDAGRVRHAHIRIGDSTIMVAEEFEYLGVVAKSPIHLGGTSMQLYLYLDDVDAAVERAAQAGATVIQPAADQFYGDRTGGVSDPFGHVWWLATHIEDVSEEEMARRMNEAPRPSGC